MAVTDPRLHYDQYAWGPSSKPKGPSQVFRYVDPNEYTPGPPQGFTRMEPTMSLDQRMRLLEIAHETKDDRVREEALLLLRSVRAPSAKDGAT